MVSKRRLLLIAAFFLFFWLAVVLFSTTVHEIGHALAVALAGGWRNSLVFFGGAAYHEPVLWLTILDQVQASGFTPAQWGDEQNLALMGQIARLMPTFRIGVLGGWLGQLVAAALAFLVVRSRVFRAAASTFSRLFWGAFVLFNPAWVGGLWLLDGLWPPNSSDSAVLVNAILGNRPLALAALWLLGAGLVALALWLADRIGGQVFAPLGLSAPASRKLALLWTALIAVTALPGKLPLPGNLDAIVGALIAVPLMTVGPLWLLLRSNRNDAAAPRVPAYAWLGIGMVLGLILFGLLSRSGFMVRGDSASLQMQIIQAHYCEQVKCAPEDALRWFR